MRGNLLARSVLHIVPRGGTDALTYSKGKSVLDGNVQQNALQVASTGQCEAACAEQRKRKERV